MSSEPAFSNDKKMVKQTNHSDISKTLRRGIWVLGSSFWIFGLTDRSVAALADGYLSALDLVQLLTAAFFFISWLFLKPA